MDVCFCVGHEVVFFILFLKKEAMINKLCHELRVLSSYIEYFYQSVHRFQTDAPSLYHSIAYNSTWNNTALDFCKKNIWWDFQRLLTDDAYVQTKDQERTSKKKSLIGKG